MSNGEPEGTKLPNRWQEIREDKIYCSSEGRLVAFSQTQVQLGSKIVEGILHFPGRMTRSLTGTSSMTSTLKEHPIWHGGTQALEQINSNQLASHHLQACQGEINGYWDETDQFYKTTRFIQLPIPKLISSSLGLTSEETGNTNWLQLKYSLTIPLSADSAALHPLSVTTIGELSLILDDSLESMDENWLIDIKSPYVSAIQWYAH